MDSVDATGDLSSVRGLSPEALRRADALVRLLADDAPRIRRIARENLSAMGEPVLALVEERSRQAPDQSVRAAASVFLDEQRRERVLALWEEAWRSGGLDLEGGVALIARSEFPSIGANAIGAALDGFADVLRRRIAAVRSNDALIERVNHLLFRELGFRGDRNHYYDPGNSYLNVVLERRRGIPVTLSAVYILVCRRLHIAVEGVGIPGHFLLRYRSGRKARFLDAFNQGKELTYQDCVAFLEREGLPFRELYLRKAEDRETLTRMLGNLLRIYEHEKDEARMERVNRMLAAIPGSGLST